MKPLIDKLIKMRDEHIERSKAVYAECLVEEERRVSAAYNVVLKEAGEWDNAAVHSKVTTMRDDHVGHTKDLYAGCLADEIKYLSAGWDVILEAAKEVS